MRKRIYEIIELSEVRDIVSNIYDIFMIVAILLSLLPLAFKTTCTAFEIIDIVTVVIFILDYILRLITADYKLPDKKGFAFLLYPFTPMAIIDLLSILPSLRIFNSGLKLLRVIRFVRALRVLRALKFVRYSKSFAIIGKVFKRQKKVLLTVASLAVAYILLSALVVFNIEPDSFDTFFDAIYWATVSLTTVGYGDIYPISTIGRIVTMVSSVFGIAIIALPSGVITAGYLDAINEEKKEDLED